MTRKLTVTSGPEAGRTFDLQIGAMFRIGRGRESHTQIADARMSRLHCRIEWKGERAILVDEESATGTMIDGAPIQKHELRPGLVFQIGDSHLRFDAPCHDLPTIVTPAAPAPALATPAQAKKAGVPTKAPRLPDLKGRTLGTFRLDKIITTTRSGMLFLAHDTERDRTAAVKVLAPDLAHEQQQKERFVRAMKTMLPLKHPNLVRIFNAGRSGPFCWTAMEYIEGESLIQVIDRIGIDGMLDWREAWRVAVHIGRALQFANEKNVVHRNVTPTNILRRRADKLCLLGDLMLARALAGTTAVQITQAGQLVGELAYMAPERTTEHGLVDTRSDLYGLGATLYALLVGRPPFIADTVPEMVHLVREQVPRRPREFQFSVHAVFEDVVMKLLAKDPMLRCQSPAEFLSDLERIGRFANLEADSDLWT